MVIVAARETLVSAIVIVAERIVEPVFSVKLNVNTALSPFQEPCVAVTQAALELIVTVFDPLLVYVIVIVLLVCEE